MALDERVVDLLLRYEDLCERGRPPTPEELCRDCPDLLGEVRQRLQHLRAINEFASTEAQGAAPSAARERRWDGAGLRYRPLHFHAEGGLGEVWVAQDDELNRQVALKRIRPDKGPDNPGARRRFLLEAEIAGRLEHPGVVPVHGLGYDAQGQPCYAMRLIRGETLADAAKAFHDAGAQAGQDSGQRRLAFRDLLGRFAAACKTVAYAHSRGVIHRDLKPGNIMLGKFGETLVVDWGLAKPVERTETERASGEDTLVPEGSDEGKTAAGYALGSPAYMSPEQAAGRWDEVGPASDIYSLGATLYMLLTGQAPRQGSRDQVMRKAKSGEFVPPRQVRRDVPRPLEAVCLKAMALKPGDRYTTALELAADVDRWLADEVLLAYREPWAARARRYLRRHRTVAVGAATALVLAVLGLAVWTINVSAHNRELRQEKDRGEKQLALLNNFYADVGNIGKDRTALTAFRNTLAATEKLVEQYPEQPEYRRLLAQGHFNLGTLHRDARRLDDAAKSYQEALQAVAQARAAAHDTPELRRLEAAVHHSLGNTYADQGHRPEAEKAYDTALTIRQALAAAHPETPDYRADEAATHFTLGAMLADFAGRTRDAEDAYGKALALLHALVAEHADVLRYKANLASAHYNLGKLQSDNNRDGEARASYQAALDLQRGLVRHARDVPEYQADLAHTLTGLGRLAVNRRDHEEGLRAFLEARDIRQALVKAYPNLLDYQSDLAQIENNLGYLYEDMKQLPEAREAYQAAVARQRQLVKAAPTVPYLADLATFNSNLGAFLSTTGERDAAEEPLLASLGIWERLAREHRDVTDYGVNLGGVCQNLAGLMLARGKPALALAWAEHWVAVLEEVQRRDPDSADARQGLATAKVSRLTTRAAAGAAAPGDPVADWDRALSLYQGTDRDFLRGRRAVALAGRGDHAAAVAEAKALGRGDHATAETLFLAARSCALAASAALRDDKLAADRREKVSESYKDQALALLLKAQTAGWFGVAGRRNDLRAEADFKPLAGRPDFRKLLGEP
jgi:serine/threonine-protein kinase